MSETALQTPPAFPEIAAPSAPTIRWDEVQVPARFLERIPLRFARDHAIVAIEEKIIGGEGGFVLAYGLPDRIWALDRIAFKLDAEVETLPGDAEEIRKLLDRAFHAEAKEVTEVADELAAQAPAGNEIALSEDVLVLDDKAPAVKLVHAMLLQAVRDRASDIHIEPAEGYLRVRFRIDGVLYDRARLRAEVREGVTSRIKVMGQMDIAERRLPQDGGVTIRIGQRRIDLRIATLPSQHGERVVLRLLDKHTGLMCLDNLGLDSDDLGRMRRILHLSHGIVLVTGPTGSGKTTSLYAMLTEMNSSELNILTLEDPVEYQLPGITQTQISEKKGLSFARGLRSLVRQDPDIIMVGEIRDFETASVAIQSALTGHLVLSTLHTNDAPSSITRLLDLGVEPYLAASSLNATIAQRLVRVVCAHCRRERAIDRDSCQKDGWTPEDLDYLKARKVQRWFEGAGCEKCVQTGFLGRTAIYEILFIDDPLRELVYNRSPAGQIKRSAVERGMKTLRQAGLCKIAEGVTTFEEVRAVTQMDLL